MVGLSKTAGKRQKNKQPIQNPIGLCILILTFLESRRDDNFLTENSSSSVRTHCLKTQELRKIPTDLARFKGRRTAALSNKTKEKSTFSTADRDSNLEPPVINNMIYCESSALDHAAIE
uniref:Uncharacterized protein n=1 Tax=Timema poppense TaxID=170557 RepID=A0A7R9H528_TIMPO|nr:unnamed protein product [Timema poppensis]